MARSVVGKMDSYVDVQRASTASDSIGGSIPTHASARKMWMRLTPLTGYREIQYKQLVNGKPYDFECIYPQDFTFDEECTIVYGSKTLHVHSVINKDEHTRTAKGIAYEKT